MTTVIDDVDIREIGGSKFYLFDGQPHVKVGGDSLRLESEPFESLLHFLKIPTKYLYRLLEESPELACASVNCWLEKGQNIGALVDIDTIEQIFDSKRVFVPYKIIRDGIQKYLAGQVAETSDNGVYISTFSSGEEDVVLANEEKAFISYRVIFSECFVVTPRIDAVLTVRGGYENYYFPVEGRKLRIANCSPNQILFQMIEFIDLLAVDMHKVFLPKLNEMIAADARLSSAAFVGRLCSELRLSKKIGKALMEGLGEQESLHEIVRKIGNNLMPEVRPDFIPVELAREIEIALSRAIVYARFK